LRWWNSDGSGEGFIEFRAALHLREQILKALGTVSLGKKSKPVVCSGVDFGTRVLHLFFRIRNGVASAGLKNMSQVL
jgi:hypothetical protein